MSELNLKVEQTINSIENFEFEPIKGQPMLRWTGKRPFTSTQFYPAQLKESYGKETDGWMNKIFWGDNLQVMSHLLKKYRGQVDLVYIDPPFDSKADYKRKISLRGQSAISDNSSFEEKQYTDIWSNDEYLQFIYERLILIRELLSDKGSIYLHCDWHKSHHLRMIMDEVFGDGGKDTKGPGFKNEVIWAYRIQGVGKGRWARKHDTILFYSKTGEYTFNQEKEDVIYQKKFIDTETVSPDLSSIDQKEIDKIVSFLKAKQPLPDGYKEKLFNKYYSNVYVRDVWDCDYTKPIISGSSEYLNYPTQKPEGLLERIIKASSNPGDIVFDCFMGSGTTQAVAMRLGRKFIGADINLGSIETSILRLKDVANSINERPGELFGGDASKYYTGFELYNVNDYDVFRNPAQARDILVEALELQSLPSTSLYDGEKDGRMVKIMPVNRIATKQDLNALITGFPREEFEKKQAASPGKPVELITLVCMGHEPTLAADLEIEMKNEGFIIDVNVLDILQDRGDLEFRHDSEATITIETNNLVIKEFYPMNLLQKLSLEKESVENWKELVDSVKIDFNYNGQVFSPSLIDIPGDRELVKGKYLIPSKTKKIMVKITDLLSESYETVISVN